ncbi:MAG TPA: ABC transporter ATP-binding protein/permease [Anaerolineae bacterium]|nr:ABC transporter ATP-binding protein/permease [Anaerolineae bacterium]
MTDIIELTDLQRRFKHGDIDVLALRGLDLTVAQGEFVALVGPSGSGKSTLLNLLGGLDRPSAGEIWVAGVPLHEADEKARTEHRRRRVGFIFQSFNLLPRLTALENVAVPLMLAGVGRAEREARAQAMLERVGLGHRLDHYPAEMSGGEQQRTAVARALIHNPAIILADEPTGNLDSVTGDSIMSLLKQLNQEEGITLILVTHDEEVAGYADRIVKLRDGQIVEIVEQERPSLSPVPSPVNQPKGKGHLSFGDIVRGALLNLRRRPVRNILTAGGVLIGIVTLVAMVSFGVGVQIEVQRNFETVGLENVFVRPQFAEGDEFDPFAPPKPEQPITPDVVARIEAIPEVTAVTPSLVLPQGIDLTLTLDDTAQPIRVSEGGESRFSFGDTTETMAGSRLADGQSAGVVLVAGLADKFLAEGETYDDLIGQPVTLTARLPRGETADFPTTIIGVRDSFGSRTIDLGLAEREAIKAWWFGQPDILQTEGYDLLMVRAVELGAVTAVIEAIEEMNLSVQSLEAILDVANQVLALLQALLGSVGALALLVAALGVANTMMMAIYERTREIGILKALGASRGEIRSMFTVESAMLGLLGGVFGLFFGFLLGRFVDWVAHRYLINEGITGIGPLSVIPWWLAAGAILFAILIGILAGIYPAARAAKLDPVKALRHE